MQRPFMMGQMPPGMIRNPTQDVHNMNGRNFNMMTSRMPSPMTNMMGMGNMRMVNMNPGMMGTNYNMMLHQQNMMQQQQQQQIGMQLSQQNNCVGMGMQHQQQNMGMEMSNMMTSMMQNSSQGLNMMQQNQMSQMRCFGGIGSTGMGNSGNFMTSGYKNEPMQSDRNEIKDGNYQQEECRFPQTKSSKARNPHYDRPHTSKQNDYRSGRSYQQSSEQDKKSSRSSSSHHRNYQEYRYSRSREHDRSSYSRKRSRYESSSRNRYDSESNYPSETDSERRERVASDSDRGSRHSRSPSRYKKSSFSRDRRRNDYRSSKRGRGEDNSYSETDDRTMDSEPSCDTDKPDNLDSTPLSSKNACDEENNENKTDMEDVGPSWVRCSPADLYFTLNHQSGCVEGTKKMKDLEDLFERELVNRSKSVIAEQSEPAPVVPPTCTSHDHHHHHHSTSSSSDSDTDSDTDSDEEVNARMAELDRKKNHPHLLHPELWYNEPGQVNDGPLCRCSIKSRQTGIRHNIYPGEEEITTCDPASNNKGKLHHYRVAMSPPTNFLTKCPTIIEFDNHEYIFEGFSLFSHYELEKIPICRVIRFNIEYSIHFIEEPMPENFSVRSLDLFTQYLFNEILELIDIDWRGPGSTNTSACHIMHLMPRFSRSLPENGKEVLSMNEVLNFLLKNSKILIDPVKLPQLLQLEACQWQDFIDAYRGMIVFYPGKRPSSLRIDQLDRKQESPDKPTFPLIIHFGTRPAQLSYVGDPAYQRLWKQYIKFRHLLSSKPKVSASDKIKLHMKEQALQELRTKSTMKREVTVEISSEGFICTGLKADVSQHAMLIPVLLGHLRFHKCLSVLENEINYRFKDRYLLQLALTHTSYRVNYGTNPDHARNSLANVGRRQVEYGSRKVLMQNTRKRGLNILIDIMSRMGKGEETLSEIPHNERLEFLGDAVVEFLSSVHLFFMFPWIEEGGLSTYRTALVQNQHLAILAKKLRLQEFMLYAHGPDLCHEYDLRHAMANCFEALMGALFLDGGIELADRIFGSTLFGENEELLGTWSDVPLHPLQEDQPDGDRQWIESSHILQKLQKFEEAIGVTFDHIRILARAFTPRNVGYTNLTLGHNQRLEFLGDTVLQLIASEYLFKHFPEHHEGHLTLLRSSLVNNRTQSIVCDDLGMVEYVIYDRHIRDKGQLKTKEKADLLEAFIGALYVDKDLDYCRVFCEVCFFPRLHDFILNQDWNDPKSQLQQCCLTLRELDGGEPDIPIYKVIESKGPTNTRMYVVAVYFRGERLATGQGHSIQQAEMSAATNAMQGRQELFPIILHQKRFLEHRHKQYLKKNEKRDDDSSESEQSSRRKSSRSRSSRRR